MIVNAWSRKITKNHLHLISRPSISDVDETTHWHSHFWSILFFHPLFYLLLLFLFDIMFIFRFSPSPFGLLRRSQIEHRMQTNAAIYLNEARLLPFSFYYYQIIIISIKEHMHRHRDREKETNRTREGMSSYQVTIDCINETSSSIIPHHVKLYLLYNHNIVF